MKRMTKITTLLIALVMTLLMSQAAWAIDQTYTGGTFVFDGKDLTNTDAGESVDEIIKNLEPGDTVSITVEYKNKSDADTEWYLSNTVLRTLEETVANAKNGGYTYTLTNTDSKGKETVLFTSDAVAGHENYDADKEDKGLEEATNATDEWFHIDSVASGGGGKTTLKVGLDGESQVNAYMSSNGSLELNYAVEKSSVADTYKHVHKTVNTGDDTKLLLPLCVFLASALLLIIAILSIRKDRKDGDEA